MIRHLGKFNNAAAIQAAIQAGTLAEPYVALDVSSNVVTLALPEGDNPAYINYRRDVPVRLTSNITLQDYYCANSPYLNAKINLPLVFDYVGDYTPAVRVIDKAWFIQRMTEDELTEDELVALCFGGSDEYVRNEFNYMSPVPTGFEFDRPVTWLSGKGFNNDGYTSSAGDDLPVPCYDSSLHPLGDDGSDRQGYYIILAAFLDPETGLPGQNLTFKVGEYRMQPYLTSDSSLVAYGMQYSLRAYWWEDEEQTLLGSWYAVPQNTIYDKAKFLMYWAEDYSTPAEAMVGSAGAVVEYDLSPQTNFYFGNDGWNLSNGGETTLHARIAVQLYNTTSGVTSDVFGYAGPDVPAQGEEPVDPSTDTSTYVYQIYDMISHNNDGFYDSSAYVTPNTKVVFNGNVLNDGVITHGIHEYASVPIGDAHPGFNGTMFRLFGYGNEYYYDRGSEQHQTRIKGGTNDGSIHVCEYGNYYIKVDGQYAAITNTIPSDDANAAYSRVPIGIFGAYHNAQINTANGLVNLKSFKIYEGETLVRDFVPAVNDSSAVGLLDRVSYQFFENQVQGEGALTEHRGFISVTTDASGNVVDTSTDLITTGYKFTLGEGNAAYFNSGYVPNTDTVVQFKGVLKKSQNGRGYGLEAATQGNYCMAFFGYHYPYDNTVYFEREGYNNVCESLADVDSSTHEYEFGNCYINVDGNQLGYGNTISSTNDADTEFYIFALGDVENGGIRPGLAPAGSELEYIKFLEPDGEGGLELMMDLRPALDADNNPCLLDMVNGDLIHTSGGTPVITVTALEEEE